MTSKRERPRILSGLREIADQFESVLLDQWGALHEGKTIFPTARDCLRQMRQAGKKVLVLSNSGKRSRENARRLVNLGLPADAYDGVLTSGEVAWRGLRDRDSDPFRSLGECCFLITRGEDRSIVDGLPVKLVDHLAADFILLAGLDDDKSSAAFWRIPFQQAVDRNLPMLCANPDLTMFGADGIMPAPGALAACYAEMGGEVAYIGKPHPPIFAAARRQLGDPKPERIVVIGDSLDHDILGGRQAGMLTVLIASGVHATVLRGAPDLARAVSDLAVDPASAPDWIIDHLVW